MLEQHRTAPHLHGEGAITTYIANLKTEAKSRASILTLDYEHCRTLEPLSSPPGLWCSYCGEEARQLRADLNYWAYHTVAPLLLDQGSWWNQTAKSVLGKHGRRWQRYMQCTDTCFSEQHLELR